MSYTNVLGGYPGLGNMLADPEFTDPGALDYRIAPTSPVRDRANPHHFDACFPSGIGGPRTDMGAYGGIRNCGLRETCQLEVVASGYPAVLGEGGVLRFDVEVDNPCDTPLSLDRAELQIMGPAEARVPLYNGAGVLLDPGSAVQSGIEFIHPPDTQAGLYSLAVAISIELSQSGADQFNVEFRER